jgi:DNA-binding NarL/FixJ family response regulator
MNSQLSILNSQLIRVAVIDDHKIITDGLSRLIDESETARVIGKAFSVAECWKLLANEQPDVLLLDIGLPDGNGLNLCSQLKEKYPQLKVLILTSYGELSTIKRALDAGADGYVLKNSMPEELLEGISTVMSGERFLCEEAGNVLKENEKNPMELTRREVELLQLIVEGYTLPELADKMCLGYQTVRSYRKNLNIKLNAHNTAQLIQNAKALKLV